MEKQKLIITLLVLALSSLPCCMANDDLHTGFGVSDYDALVTLELAETVWVDIARLYNTGDFNLTVTCTWIFEHNPVGVQLDLTPQNVRLEPSESVLIRARATGQTEGEFMGEIDFSCDVELPTDYKGNPSVPGGTAHARFLVQRKQQPRSVFNWPLVIVAIASGVIVAITVGWKKKKGDNKK